MYKYEGLKKDALLTHIAYHLLEKYADGFEYLPGGNPVNFDCNGMEDEKVPMEKYVLQCPKDPFQDEIIQPRRALLVWENEQNQEVRCRAGGLSATMLAEMVMVVYYHHFAKVYGEECPINEITYKSRLENMKDYILRMVKKDETIRAVQRCTVYFGYVKRGQKAKKELSFSLKSETEPEAIERLVSADEEVPLDCFGRRQSKLYQSYRLQEDMQENKKDKNTGETILTLDRFYKRNDDGVEELQKKEVCPWPKELLPSEVEQGITIKDEKGWYCFGQTLSVQKRGFVYIEPTVSANKGSYVPMKLGKYILAWHQNQEFVDSIVLTLCDFEMKNLPGINQGKEMLPLAEDWVDKLKKKLEKAEKSPDRFVYKRNKNSTQDNWISILKYPREYPKDADDIQSCILCTKEKDEVEGFVLTELAHRDFFGYRHRASEESILPDTLVFCCRKANEEKEEQEEVAHKGEAE